MTKLSVNLNKIALLRNSRETKIPSVVEAAETVIAGGADGITVHPRPDQRHITPNDVFELSSLLKNLSTITSNLISKETLYFQSRLMDTLVLLI